MNFKGLFGKFFKKSNECNGEAPSSGESFCVRLLDIYNDGIHKDRITVDMVPAIQEAADNGDGLAAYVMGKLCESGLEIEGETIVEEDADAMFDYYRKGAEAGNKFAQGEYGIMLCNGWEGSSEHEDGDDEAGFPWIEKAGENGNVLALHRMTYAYLDGSFSQFRDLDFAYRYFSAILAVKDKEGWKAEFFERATGYVKYLPKIIRGDSKAMRALAKWLKEKEGGWEYSWGLGEKSTESEYWDERALCEEDTYSVGNGLEMED